MYLNLGTLMFNMPLDEGGTPSWGTDMGQGDGYRFNFTDMDNLLISMLYQSIEKARDHVWCPLGKGGNRQSDYEYVLASRYDKVFVNNIPLNGASFVLLIVKQILNANGFHIGRRTLKYSPKITFDGAELNGDCFNKMRQVLGVTQNGAWFVSEIFTKNQDELHFVAFVVDKTSKKEFHTTEDRKKFLNGNFPLTNHDLASSGSNSLAAIPSVPAFNLIVYGTPGCGKSFYVENKLLNAGKYVVNGTERDGLSVDASRRIRTTFFQDYTNTDFVGQILPTIDGEKVSYDFNPGPFTTALLMALDPECKGQPVALIIEELNRGSAASIFGDIFQLLDRDSTGKSVYSITNKNISDYLNKELKKKYPSWIDIKEIYIPSNLFIIATMNTSDQNVFTLDTAFKRRWKFEKLANEFTSEHDYRGYFVPGFDSNYTYENIIKSINEYMVANSDQFMNEDKQIGIYFLEKGQLIENKMTMPTTEQKREVAFKLLEYLWDDVSRMQHDFMFQGTIKTLDELLAAFEKDGEKVFAQDLQDLLEKNK